MNDGTRSAEERRRTKLKTLLKQKDEEDNTPLLLAVQVQEIYLVIGNLPLFRRATVTQWGFSSTRRTRCATSTSSTKSTKAHFILPQGRNHYKLRSSHLSSSLNDHRSGDKRTVELLVNNGAKVTILKSFCKQCFHICGRRKKSFLSCFAGEHHQPVGGNTSPLGS